MSMLETIQRYFSAWNRHDLPGLVATFAPDGVYRDPIVPGGLTGDAIGAYARQLAGMIPDVNFEVISLAATGEHSAAGQWLMRGNSGAGAVALPGADFFEVAEDGIRSVRGYFDQQALDEQLGDYNWCQRNTSGRLVRPGAFSLTWIDVAPEEMERMGSYGQRLGREMMEKPGALTKLTAGAGARWYTASAWEKLDDVAEMRRTNQAHKEAMHAFFNGELGGAVHTSVWIPHHIGPIWVRCAACRKVADYEKSRGECPNCRETLPRPSSYW